jgi:dienelactone hydrolase
VDATGTLDLSRATPVAGTYAQPDGAGLWWSMALESDPGGLPPIFIKATRGPHEVRLRVLSDGQMLAETVASLALMAPDVEVQEVSTPCVGVYARRGGHRRLPGVVILGGSTGGLVGLEQVALLLASHGYAACALAYFDPRGSGGLPTALTEIPLEYVAGAIAWVRRRPEVQDAPIGVIGSSKGAELALLMGAYCSDEVGAVVANAPSSHVFEGIDFGPRTYRSSWTFQGAPLPFVPYPPDDQLGMDTALTPLSVMHERALAGADAARLQAARIPVERLHGPVMLVAGGQDTIWPSSAMCAEIVRTLRADRFPHEIVYLDFPHAGHVFYLPNLPVAAGPTRESAVYVAAATREAWASMLAFLERSL